jgi:hypothetical protein
MAGPRITYQAAIVPLILLALAGAASLALGLLLLAGGALSFALPLIVAAALAMAVARRPRVVWLDLEAGTLTVTWGRRWPLPIARYAADAWIAFAVETRMQVSLIPQRGGGTRRRDLPELCFLHGRTRDDRDVEIAICAGEIEARELRASLARRCGVALAPFRYEARAGRGDRDWEGEPFFAKEPAAARLYRRLIDATAAEPVDVVGIASLLKIRRPWALIARLEQQGWLRSAEVAGETEAQRLAALERKLGWADPDVLAHVLGR